jgi:SET family sugar efflux transporter-like MFS transporter
MSLSPLRLIARNADLRLVAGLMLLQGAFICTLAPYVSVLAVREFGLGDLGYAGVMTASTVVSVTAAIAAGIRADQTANRRGIALWSCWLMVAGCGVMTVLPGAISFVLAHALILPLSALFGQLFAQGRLAAQAQDPALRDGIMTTIRALFAVPFVAILPLWALAFQNGAPILSIYPVTTAFSVAMLALTARYWPTAAAATWQDPPSGLSLRQALGELAAPGLQLRILSLGAISAGGSAYWAVMGLVLSQPDGTGADRAALYAGLVAGLEVPLMLALPWILPRFNRTHLIFVGTVIYAIQLVGIPLLAGSTWLWLCLIPGAVGGAITLTLPIAYLQDALGHRPGTGAALMALMQVAGNVMAAAAFALGTALSGYLLAAVLAAGLTVLGALVLIWADRSRA